MPTISLTRKQISLILSATNFYGHVPFLTRKRKLSRSERRTQNEIRRRVLPTHLSWMTDPTEYGIEFSDKEVRLFDEVLTACVEEVRDNDIAVSCHFYRHAFGDIQALRDAWNAKAQQLPPRKKRPTNVEWDNSEPPIYFRFRDLRDKKRTPKKKKRER